MNLTSIGGTPAQQIVRPGEGARTHADRQVAQGGAAAVAPSPTPARVAAASGLLAPRAEVVPVEAPAGTDPQLWAVLTADERSFFSRMSASGPLTYGRQMAASHTQAPVSRGGRIDVRA